MTHPNAQAAAASPPLVYRAPLGRLPWVLAPLGAVFLALSLRYALTGSPDAWAGFGLGTLFLLVAALFALTRGVLVVDVAAGTWRYARGALHPTRSGRLAELGGVRLGVRMVPGADLEERADFTVVLGPAGEAAVPVLDTEDPVDAQAWAETLSRRLDLPLVDARDPAAPQLLEPDESGRRIALRLRAGARSPGPVPPGIQTSPGALTLPPRPTLARLAPGIAAGLLLAFLVGAHLFALFHGRRTGAVFALYAAPFDLLALWLLFRAALRAFGAEVLEYDLFEVRLGRRLGARLLPRWREPLERILSVAAVDGAVVLETPTRALRLGRGLDEAQRTWLAAHLSERLAEAAGQAYPEVSRN